MTVLALALPKEKKKAPGPKRLDEAEKIIGGALRLERCAKQLSMEKIAQKIGISWQQIYKIEQGTNRLSVLRLIELASLIGFDPGHFVNDLADDLSSTDRSSIREEMQAKLSVKGAPELLQLYANMTAKGRHALLELMRTMVVDED